MRELENILTEYYEDIRYVAYLQNQSKIDFEDLDELLSYENIDGRNIKEIYIYGKLDCDITAMSLLLSNKTVEPWKVSSIIKADYSVNTADDEITLTNRLMALFCKTKTRYWLGNKICCASNDMLMLATLITCIAFLFNVFLDSDLKIIFLIFLISLMIFVLIMNAIKSNFPSIVFCWGAQIETNQRIANIRNHFFWGILVTFTIGIITFFVTKSFT